MKGNECIGGKTIVVKQVTGIGFGDGEVWRIDFAPITIGLAPEDRSPGFVESVNGLILGFKPAAESDGTRLAIAASGVVATKLIINLPADNGRVTPVAGGHGRDYALCVMAIGFVVRAVVPARTRTAAATLNVYRKNIRIRPA